MGPKTFEKEFIKRCGKLWNETKVLFFHDGSTTTIKYPFNDKLLGVETHRDVDHINRWAPYFVEYLETGRFDTNAYWRIYANENELRFLSETTAIPMVLKNQLWSTHSPEFNDWMREVRSEEGMVGVGFYPQFKPTGETNE